MKWFLVFNYFIVFIFTFIALLLYIPIERDHLNSLSSKENNFFFKIAFQFLLLASVINFINQLNIFRYALANKRWRMLMMIVVSFSIILGAYLKFFWHFRYF